MLINVSALMQENIGARRAYGFTGETVNDAAINCDAELMRTDAGILVSASCVSERDETCSLCLKRYRETQEFSFAEEYFPVIDITTGKRLPPRDSSEDLSISQQHLLDVGDAVRQYLILHELQNPVCAPNCAGLCPQCGADRNTVSCTCPSEPARSEWAALREIWASRSQT